MPAHHLFLKILKQPFPLIWFALTIVAAFSTVWLIRHASAKVYGVLQGSRTEPQPASRGRLGPVIGLFCLFVVGYIVLIFAGEDFAYYDNSQFTLYSLKGINFPFSIWVDSGRFCPLALQEFNVIRHFSTTIAAYHAFSVLQLLIVCAILLLLDRDLDIRARIGLAICALLCPGMVISFGGLIYLERDIVFWLLCLIFFVKRFDRTQSVTAAVAAIVSAQCMLYYKESAFVLLWGFVAGRLLLRCRNADGPRWDFRRLRESSSCLDFCLGALGFAFLVYYAATMFGHTRLRYAQQHRLPELDVLLLYLKMNLLTLLLAAVAGARALLIWKRKIIPSPFWEGLAWGGLAYFASYLGLAMYSAYYLAPVDLIAVLYLGRLVALSWNGQRQGRKVVIGLAVCVVLAQIVSLSSVREFERKNLIRAKAEMAGIILARYQHDNGATLRLFFPFASRYVTMEFGAYLSYRGIPIEDGFMGKPDVLLISRAMPADGKLVDYQNIIGHPGQVPEPLDLVIILPDDNASFADVEPYLKGGDRLFLYDPCARFPQWLWACVKPLHFVSPPFEHQPLPDHWLAASVTAWSGHAESGDRTVNIR
jgi:hypothetical protein